MTGQRAKREVNGRLTLSQLGCRLVQSTWAECRRLRGVDVPEGGRGWGTTEVEVEMVLNLGSKGCGGGSEVGYGARGD